MTDISAIGPKEIEKVRQTEDAVLAEDRSIGVEGSLCLTSSETFLVNLINSLKAAGTNMRPW